MVVRSIARSLYHTKWSKVLPQKQPNYRKLSNQPVWHDKFDNAELYEKFMGVWSQLVSTQFIEWLAPAKGQTWVDIGQCLLLFTTLEYFVIFPIWVI